MMALKAVPDLSPIDRAKIEIKNGYYNVPEMSARLGLAQSVLLDLIPEDRKGEIKVKKRGRPRKTEQQPPPLPKLPPEPIIPKLIGFFFILSALTAAAVGANMSWQFGYSIFGLSGGAIGLVVDFGALSFLPAARELYRLRNPLCILAFFVWWPFLIGSSYAALNYTGVNIGDYFQGRGDVEMERSKLTDQLKREEAKRAQIQENGDAKVLENEMNLALGMVPKFNRTLSQDCANPTLSKDVCAEFNRIKGAWNSALARDRIEGGIAELRQKLRLLPHIASKNPAAEQAAQMSDGRINAEQAQNYSIRWWAIVPGFASIMLTIGLALCSKKRMKDG